jgi:hypothetical protein
MPPKFISSFSSTVDRTTPPPRAHKEEKRREEKRSECLFQKKGLCLGYGMIKRDPKQSKGGAV